MNAEMMDNAIKQQADAWSAVYLQLLAFNPDFTENGKNGMESAINEIKRLQQSVAARESLQKALGSEAARLIVEVEVRSVYGKNLVYPANETAHKFAALIGVKTFNRAQIDQIKGLGYFLALTSSSVLP
jgi:hypothetical protein